MRWGIRSTWGIVALSALALAFAAACSGSDSAYDGGDGASVKGTDAINGLGEGSTTGMDTAGREGYNAALPMDEQASGEAPAVMSDPGAGGAGAPLPQLLDRKLIRTATLEVETGEVSQKFEEVANVALSSGGLVFSSSFGNDGERQTASITIRIPGERYQDALIKLRKLGTVRSEQSNATDVTEEYVDLQSRLRNLQATDQQYLALLQRATTINDILVVQDRLNGIRAEIEQVQGRINLLADQTDLSTITVHLMPPVPALEPKDDGARGPLETAADAFDASLAVLAGIATVALAVAAFSWWIVPFAAAGLYVVRRQLREERGRRQAPPPAPGV